MALSAEQQRVVRRAIAQARKMDASPREVKALVTASGVESDHQHDRYARVGSGDRDSVGFLQQRPSMGWGPAGESIEKDTAQFLRAAKKLNRAGFKGSAGQLAQAVQRSAFPARYDQRGSEADALIRKFGGKSSRGAAPSSTGATTKTTTTVTGAGFDPGPGMSALAQLAQQQRPQPPTSLPSPPQFAASAAMPQGYQAPSAAPVQSEPSGLSDLLSSMTSSGQSIPQVDVQTRTATIPGEKHGGSKKVTGSFSGKARGGFGGSEGPARQLAKIGTDLGLQVTSTKRNNQNPHSGRGSDHDHGNKDAFAFDLSNGDRPTAEMDRAAFRMARALGIKDYKMGQPIMRSVTRGNVRVQLIYRGDGAEYGGNHMNHVHVGVRRVR